jgi:hypothetical protein
MNEREFDRRRFEAVDRIKVDDDNDDVEDNDGAEKYGRIERDKS